MEIILLLLGAWILYGLVKFLWRFYVAYRNAKRQFNRFNDAMGGAFGGAGQSRARKSSADARKRQRRTKEKIIPADYGEYVDFQETEITGNEQFLHTASIDYVRYKRESQISDAEWEEKK